MSEVNSQTIGETDRYTQRQTDKWAEMWVMAHLKRYLANPKAGSTKYRIVDVNQDA